MFLNAKFNFYGHFLCVLMIKSNQFLKKSAAVNRLPQEFSKSKGVINERFSTSTNLWVSMHI